MRHLSASRMLLGATMLLALGSNPLATTRAQDPAPPVASRDALYEELANEMALIERQARLLKRVVNLIRPTIVHIEASKRDLPNRRALEEAGSGIIIQHKGEHYVITNGHVIADATADSISIKLNNGRTLRPKRTWIDEATDIAVLKVSGTGLIASRLGNSRDVDIGDFVLAVGSPFGLSHSVTFGIVSAKGRRDLQLGSKAFKYQEFIQTDAAINPGNSGGPLLNLKGEVIGINTAIASSSGGNEGIGFSVPINMAMFVAERLIEEGVVKRAFLGVTLDASYSPEDAFTLGLNRFEGARVSRTQPGSAAELAQIRSGDVLLEFDGVRIEDDNHLINCVGMTDIGKQVSIGILRDGKMMTLAVKVSQRQ